MEWTEERIRKELDRLDQFTSLHGNNPPIEFTHTRCTPGRFVIKAGSPCKFRFSQRYFNNNVFSIHETYNVIRHEYTHYMSFVLNSPCIPHGHERKTRCPIIEAKTLAHNSPDESSNHLHIERADEARTRSIRKITLKPHNVIKHPLYGPGMLLDIQQTETDTRLDVLFLSDERNVISENRIAAASVKNNTDL